MQASILPHFQLKTQGSLHQTLSPHHGKALGSKKKKKFQGLASSKQRLVLVKIFVHFYLSIIFGKISAECRLYFKKTVF